MRNFVAAALAVAAASVLWPGSAFASHKDGRHTVVVLKRSVVLTRLVGALERIHARPVSFDHIHRGRRGGFVVGRAGLMRAAAIYDENFGERTGREPHVISVRLKGRVRRSRLGSFLRRRASAVRSVPPSSDVAVASPREQRLISRRRSAASASASAQVRPLVGVVDRYSPNVRSAGVGKEEPGDWAPRFGSLIGSHSSGAELPRVFEHSLTWTAQSQIDAFDEPNVYEHDTKLINRGNINFPGNFGGCPFYQRNNFWADRDGGGYEWSTTMPDAARPYADTGLDDECEVADFTIGVFYPVRLQPKTYSIFVFAKAGDEDSSPVNLVAERLEEDCVFMRTKYCVQLDPTRPRDTVALILGEKRGRELPGCINWEVGAVGGDPNQGASSGC